MEHAATSVQHRPAVWSSRTAGDGASAPFGRCRVESARSSTVDSAWLLGTARLILLDRLRTSCSNPIRPANIAQLTVSPSADRPGKAQEFGRFSWVAVHLGWRRRPGSLSYSRLSAAVPLAHSVPTSLLTDRSISLVGC